MKSCAVLWMKKVQYCRKTSLARMV